MVSPEGAYELLAYGSAEPGLRVRGQLDYSGRLERQLPERFSAAMTDDFLNLAEADIRELPEGFTVQVLGVSITPLQPLPDDLFLNSWGFQEYLLALDEAFRKFADVHPQAAEVVQLLYFGGLTLPEAAQTLEISPRTVSRHWEYARTWLRREMNENRNSIPNF